MFGTLVAVMTFFILLLHGGINMAIGKINHPFFSIETLMFIVNAFMIGVTIIVAAVPEV